jgi:enoyl-CoA hydratase/carnithine racemase
MALEGFLNQIDLATLLQTLRMEEQKGILYLVRDSQKFNLFISKEGARCLAQEEGDFTDLIEVLFRHRFLKREELEEYQKRYKRTGKPLGQFLIEDKRLKEEDLEKEVNSLVELLSGYSPLAMAIQKDICNKWMTADLETAIDYSINSVSINFASKDQKEGMKAFLEKKKPEFTGE